MFSLRLKAVSGSKLRPVALQRFAVQSLLVIFFGSSFLLGQQKPGANPAEVAPPGTQDFPVMMRQSVTAGTTLVGTKVEARLSIATLVNGTVIPRNAVLSGEVTQSAAKTATEPSRLGIRFDSAQWKNGSAQLNLYLTAWYYLDVAQGGQDLQYGPPQTPQGAWNGVGEYPDPHVRSYEPFPGADSDKKPSAPDTPNSVPSNHRVAMKNVEVENAPDGGTSLVSKHRNLKLDKVTTYVLTAVAASPAK